MERMEQIGRFGCIVFMIFSIPGTCFGWADVPESQNLFVCCIQIPAQNARNIYKWQYYTTNSEEKQGNLVQTT